MTSISSQNDNSEHTHNDGACLRVRNAYSIAPTYSSVVAPRHEARVSISCEAKCAAQTELVGSVGCVQSCCVLLNRKGPYVQDNNLDDMCALLCGDIGRCPNPVAGTGGRIGGPFNRLEGRYCRPA
jgi:hypothetical protein